jgi:Flp pilus assembly protein TadB
MAEEKCREYAKDLKLIHRADRCAGFGHQVRMSVCVCMCVCVCACVCVCVFVFPHLTVSTVVSVVCV